jgi:hypothetical protein
LVASPSPRQFADAAEPLTRSARTARRNRSTARAGRQSLELIQGSLSPRRIERQAPWMAGLHRAADGTLAGLGVCMLALSALTLHWQNQWGTSYQKLEDAQVLGHRMQESAAVLEQHHLGAVRKPGWLVPTSSEKLIYLPAPKDADTLNPVALMAGVQLRQIPTGY